jgi:transposase
VITVAILSVIRRWHWRDSMPIREIARRTGLSRNTVKKYLAGNVVDPLYARRRSPSALDAYALKLTQWLQLEVSRNRKQRRSLKQLHADLVSLGYTGSYDRVTAFARRWRQAQQELARTAGRGTFVPLLFAAGEAFQFDWSEDWAVINNERVKLQIAHFKLSHSRAFYLRAYLLQTHEMLFDAHNHAFEVLGGVPRRGIYDNMRTAVDKVRPGKQRDVNARFSAMVSHFLFEAEFCNPAAGWEKGQIEKNVQDSRRRLWQQAPRFDSLAAVNDWLQSRCVELWHDIRHPELTSMSVAAVWAQEQSQLMPTPRRFDGFVEHSKPVSPTCLVHFERCRYSVPAAFANRRISLHVYAARLVFVAEGQVIAEHTRIINRDHRQNAGQTIYDWRHYLAVLQRKPGALRNGAPFATLPSAFLQLQAILSKRSGGEREMVEILALVLYHDQHLVVQAVEQALAAGVTSKQHIVYLLSCLISQTNPLPPPLTDVQLGHAQQALALVEEPQANVSRYDDLRRISHAA